VEVTGKLKSGRNILTIHLESGLFEVSEKPIAAYAFGREELLTKRQWLRKPMHESGSIDWSNRLMNVGIQGPVRLEWTVAAARMDQLVPLVEVSPDLSEGTVVVRQFAEGLAQDVPSATPGRLTATLVEAGITTSADVAVKPGLHPYEVTLTVARPKLWWPRGQGPQQLYTLRVRFEAAGASIGEKAATIGFRRVRFNQEPHPEKGRYFFLEVNNRPVFAKGSNLVPSDMVVSSIGPERNGRLVDLAIEANFNYLRVWGGGYYEPEAFYDSCDRQGLMVWQEFSHAVLVLPAHDPEWHENAMAESVHQVRRLASHPSLIAWCGNNEMDSHAYGGYDGRADRPRYPDHGFFHLALPRMLKQEDSTRYYQPSSPYSPDELPPGATEAGDQHPWIVGMQNDNFHDYRGLQCRFSVEGGILGPRSMPTMLKALPDGQRRAHSFAWEVHENTVAGWGEPSWSDTMLESWLGLRIESLSLEEYAYWAGLLHGEGLSEYIANFRRRMFDCGAAVFWMYNDCWPAVRSWAIVDHGLRRTPAYWFVRRAFASTAVVVVKEAERVLVYGVNDAAKPVEGELEFGVFALGGGYPVRRTMSVSLPPGASTVLGEFPLARWQAPESTAAYAVLRCTDGTMARHRLLLPRFKELQWQEPRIDARIEQGTAVFRSTAFAWAVCLDLDGETPLDDNFFDLYPGMEHRIAWRSSGSPEIRFLGNTLVAGAGRREHGN
jgi:beta-mannosidase